jgi:hypothetical protein
MMVVVGDNELEKINVWPFLLFELRSQRVKGSHDTKLRTCVTPKQAIFIFVHMRSYTILLVLISFVLLAFVYWPTTPVNSKSPITNSPEPILVIPASEPHLFTSQLNNRLSDYMEKSVDQGIPAVADFNGLKKAYHQKKLLKIRANSGFVLDSFTHSYAFLTPYASQVLKKIGAAFKDSIDRTPLKGCQLIVTSMTRTHQTVRKLMRHNQTAVLKSPHLNGNTFDFSFSRFSSIKTLNQTDRAYLQTKIAQILVQLKKEHQICLHVVARQGI